MSDTSGEAASLTPLWCLTLGAVVGAGSSLFAPPIDAGWILPVAAAGGIGLIIAAARRGGRRSAPVWFLAGLVLVGGHGIDQRSDRKNTERLTASEAPVWVRARMAVTDGWSRARWGWRARVEVIGARHNDRDLPLFSRARLEVRGNVDPLALPPPGAEIEGLVSIRGSPKSPLLVATSSRLLTATDAERWLPAARHGLARALLDAAGLDVRRIRAAELAASLALGRRDLMPPSRRDGWRRSGLAHVLAVSGLHVGLVAGMAWLVLMATRASPTASRWAILIILPSYALLAGASPSAVRAALMGCVYVGARLLGRAIVPMAAVLLTASTLLIADPSLIEEISFQLTVLLTAALVRWAPVLTKKLPLPRWLAAAVAVPVIAQLAAAPLVATHFSAAIPGGAAANLLVPWLLAPVVLASVAATAAAPISATFAGWLLEIVQLGERMLWTAGAPGRWLELIPPPIPVAILILLGLSGLAALLPRRQTAAIGAAIYASTLAVFATWWLALPGSNRTGAELLNVSHGLALRITSPDVDLLIDGGGQRREAAELLAADRPRRFDVVVATHADEDHSGGLEMVLRTTAVDSLVVPHWLLQAEEAVPLIRTARRQRVRLIPVARGSAISVGETTIEVVWPPAIDLPREENERALVARVLLRGANLLVTSDIGHATERRLVAGTDVSSDILVVSHHGSRKSSLPAFLDAVGASMALIPAGPGNLHHHPHPDTIARLEKRGIDYRMPIRDGRCGAMPVDGRWVLYPMVVKSEQ